MGLFQSIFRKKDINVTNNEEFWKWFQLNEKKFYKVIKNQGDINKVFFDQLAPKLNDLREGYWFLAGMYDNDIAELIITADGLVRNFVFIEELVDAAPKMANWKITALKQPTADNTYGIEMDGYVFDETTMKFYANEVPDCPDEIDITIAHKDLNEDNRTSIINGVYIAMENSLGELNFATTIDSMNVVNYTEAEKELIDLGKLKSYLRWREKEFIEKYKGIRHHTEDDSYKGFEFTLKNRKKLVASINSDLLEWDKKASHPWIVEIRFPYDGDDNDGMPNDELYQKFNLIEDEVVLELKDSEGYLNVGRQTGNNLRELFLACKEFRKPSKVIDTIRQKYERQTDFSYGIYKDKYWQTFDKFSSKG